MTGTAINYTTPAATRLDDYLRHVRVALTGLPDVTPDEVEADIRAHVEAELTGVSQPIKLADLEVVLAALGPPAAWRPAGAGETGFSLFDWLASVGRVIYRGPEDWRLAYLCLILTLLAPLTAGLSLVVAYLLGRAAAEFARKRGELLGARRWLIYPAILMVSVPLLTAALTAPLVTIPLAYQVFIGPAEVYRDAVKSVDAEGQVHFRAGWEPSTNTTPNGRNIVNRDGPLEYQLRQAGITRTGADPFKPGGWRATEPSRAINERVIAVLNRVRVHQSFAGITLALFATLGVALAWWAVLGLIRRTFPVTTAAVVFPLLSPMPTGVPWVTVGCMVAFAAWLGAAWALMG